MVKRTTRPSDLLADKNEIEASFDDPPVRLSHILRFNEDVAAEI